MKVKYYLLVFIKRKTINFERIIDEFWDVNSENDAVPHYI